MRRADDVSVPNATLDMSEAEALKAVAKRVEIFLRAVVYSCWKQRGRLLADGTWSSSCGWNVVVFLRMERGRLLADGPWSSTDGPRSSTDGPRSSTDGPRSSTDGLWSSTDGPCFPKRVVYGWPRSSTDGPWSSACGWPAVVVWLRMARRGRPAADGPRARRPVEPSS